jgi:hypothetical protein
MHQFDEKEYRARTLEAIRAVHPTAFNLSRAQFAEIAGVTQGHISNCESVKRKPLVKPVFEGKKVLYPVLDIVDYLVQQRLKTLKSKAGRPTKASRLNGGAA